MKGIPLHNIAAIVILIVALTVVTVSAAGDAANATPPVISGPNMDAINAYNQGADLAAQGKFAEALQATDKALSIQPDFSLAWSQKAGLLVVLGRFDDAVTAANNAIAGSTNLTNSDKAIGWANKADALYELGRYSEAIQSASTAVTLDPTLKSAQDRIKLAQAMLDRKNQTTAVMATKAPLDPVVVPAGILIGVLFIFVFRKEKEKP